MNNNTTTFWNFLQENTIEIPIIQRDFAQGRTDKTHIRNSFLTNLKQALDNNLPNREQTLKLDFVYGSVEHGKLNPLDGQQRLTTLWLLHWYVALKAGKLAEATDVLKKFTYETRITSREFCQQLCNADNFKDYAKNSIVDYIASRTWFYSAWKQDPTIQSMLTMLRGTKETDKNGDDILDGIEELFVTTETENFVEYWERLTSEDAPIVFYYLPLQDFGLSDDLYIKMNARGKQLTNFENFKADLIGYIEQSIRDATDNQIKAQWEALLNPVNGLPIKLDTTWMAIFWENRSIGARDSQGKISKSHQVDEIYFAFLNRLFWNELFIAKDENGYLLDVGKDDDTSAKENENKSYMYLNDSRNRNEKFERIAYLGFDTYKYHNNTIPIAFFEKAKTILDNYLEYNCNQIPVCQWNKEFHFIPQYVVEDGFNLEYLNNSNDAILKVAALTQPERIVFFALCKYFEEGTGEEASLKQWLRVVWNLVSGESEDGKPQIRSTRAVRTAIEFISSLDSHNVYQSLAELDSSKISKDAFSERCKEEIEKAKKIVEDAYWEGKIILAENYAAFNGSISFLFTDQDGNFNWNDFDLKFGNLQQLLDKKGLKVKYRNGAKAIKIILSYCNSWWWQIESHPHDNHFIFSDSFNCWKNCILLKSGKDGRPLYASPVHHLLVGDGHSSSVPDDLSDHYRKAAFKYLIDTSIISDCYDLFKKTKDKLYIRWIYDNLCLYPSSLGFVLSMPHRDEMLLSCLENGSVKLIDSWQKQSMFFWGWNVNFIHNGFNFQWCYDDRIYLLDKDLKYKIKEADATTDDEKYYRFQANLISDSDSFAEKLKELANQITTDESNDGNGINEQSEIQ